MRNSCQSNRDTYVYSPLLNDEIRLLRFHPSPDRAIEIHVDIIHVPLLSAQNKEFLAVSYTWGLAEDRECIMVNEKLIKVRPNVVEILRKLRALQYTYIWVRFLTASSFMLLTIMPA